MKKKILAIMCVSTIIMTLLVGCGKKAESKDTVNNTDVNAVAESVAEVVESTEAPHEHAYAEEVTTPATCLEDGEATFTCECGDTYTEAIPATGHDFSNYVLNEDATYEADGTETATCTCGETDTRVAEGSMLTYTFEDMEATKYAKSTVNVRALPNTDGEKLGGLSTNDEVKVTGKCKETGWYRIEYSDGIAYVSDEYLVDEKVEVQASAPAASSMPTYASYAELKAYAISLGYPIGSAVDNGDGSYTGYYIEAINGAGYGSWDFEWSNGRCADYDASTRVGASLLGHGISQDGDYKKIKIAHTADADYDWYVKTYRAW